MARNKVKGGNAGYIRHALAGLDVFLRAFLDVHVLEFAGLEDLAALLALDEFSVLIAAYDLHAEVLAGSLRARTLLSRG
ncbi:hypothetical protein SBA1_310004 [Candidatus Sulfotelmatobacter kueseliae]|uniref:Uncharacterized protein n=1 Tax=Candidatus Sulfotelmatobacter kueseliae TaxID=2042962 RepID=A0A2U3KLR3_9BACT|nr:hypothetical protein SBA1_310004 [Candidatus Sulfotelmatobacter kueseliae]